jgi:hypothetical protein
VGSVLADGFQKTGEKRRPNDLIFGCLRVGEFDGRRAVVFAIKPGEILVV